MKDIAIVTGGGSGLGYCLSNNVLLKGANVCLVGRDMQKLKIAKDKLQLLHNVQDVLCYSGNISDEKFVDYLYTDLNSKEYQVKYLYNCAGTGRFGVPEDNTRDKIDVAFEASLVGLILMSSYAIEVMKDGGGSIVNIMSTAALKGNPNESIYCAAKWGARGFTEAIKAYTKGTKTKVVSVYPGGMNTEFWCPECGMMPDVTKFMNPEEVAEQIVNSTWEHASMYVSEIVIDRK